MRPEQLLALQSVCDSQEELQKVWDNPAVFNFNKKFQAWVTLCVAYDNNKFKWTACVRLANPKKCNFKSTVLWQINERLKARSILLDQLDGVGAVLGEEEFASTKGLFLCRLLTPEEKGLVLKPQLLGN